MEFCPWGCRELNSTERLSLSLFCVLNYYVALPLTVTQFVKCISPGGWNLLDFLDLRQVISTYDWDLRDPLWWPQERPVPM